MFGGLCFGRESSAAVKEFIEHYLEITYGDYEIDSLECFAAKNATDIVGAMYIGRCNALDCEWQLTHGVVHPEYRGKGIMSKLVGLACEGRTGGILVEAYATGEVANAHTVLVRNGFEKVGVLKDYWRSHRGCDGCTTLCTADDVCDNHLYVKNC